MFHFPLPLVCIYAFCYLFIFLLLFLNCCLFIMLSESKAQHKKYVSCVLIAKKQNIFSALIRKCHINHSFLFHLKVSVLMKTMSKQLWLKVSNNCPLEHCLPIWAPKPLIFGSDHFKILFCSDTEHQVRRLSSTVRISLPEFLHRRQQD
jgi:hypothetical protein